MARKLGITSDELNDVTESDVTAAEQQESEGAAEFNPNASFEEESARRRGAANTTWMNEVIDPLVTYASRVGGFSEYGGLKCNMAFVKAILIKKLMALVGPDLFPETVANEDAASQEARIRSAYKPVFMISGPGVGKTSIINGVYEEMNRWIEMVAPQKTMADVLKGKYAIEGHTGPKDMRPVRVGYQYVTQAQAQTIMNRMGKYFKEYRQKAGANPVPFKDWLAKEYPSVAMEYNPEETLAEIYMEFSQTSIGGKTFTEWVKETYPNFYATVINTSFFRAIPELQRKELTLANLSPGDAGTTKYSSLDHDSQGNREIVTWKDVPDKFPKEDVDAYYGLFLMDEFTSADVLQVQPGMSAMDDKRIIGEHPIPRGWIVVAAGNGYGNSNFTSLSDATVTRTVMCDIAYDYKSDWRPYALSHGIHPLVIAFLNVHPECILETTGQNGEIENTDHGVQHANPRQWTAVSDILITDANGAEMNNTYTPIKGSTRSTKVNLTPEMLESSIANVIGSTCAEKFMAFLELEYQLTHKTEENKGVVFDAQKVLDGAEDVMRVPQIGSKDEGDYHNRLMIMAMNTLNLLGKVLEANYDDKSRRYNEKAMQSLANFLYWLFDAPRVNGSYRLEGHVTDAVAVVEIFELAKRDIKHFSPAMRNNGPKLQDYCKGFDNFIKNNRKTFQAALATRKA